MRFSLRSLLIVVTLASVLCGVLFAMPAIVTLPLLGLSTLCIMPACIACIVYGRGKKKAFAIGCLSSGWWMSIVGGYYIFIMSMAGGEAFLETCGDPETVLTCKVGWGVNMAWICFSGLVSVAVRWMVRPVKTGVAVQSAGRNVLAAGDVIYSGKIQGVVAGSLEQELPPLVTVGPIN